MMSNKPVLMTGAIAALALLGACAALPGPSAPIARAPIAAAPAYAEYGHVRDIDVVAVASRPSGAGAILGAVIGGVVGNQFGSGTGRALATGAGVVGGAVAGNAIEQRNKRDDEVYRVSVRFNDGATRDFQFRQIGDLRVGDRVRWEAGQLYRM